MHQKTLETMPGNEGKRLFRDYQEFLQLQHLYSAAIKEIEMRLEVLNDEFRVTYERSPIHHIESRLKSTESIVAKMERKGLEVSVEVTL